MRLPAPGLSLLAAALHSALYANTLAAQQAPVKPPLEEVTVTGSYLLQEEMDMATGLGLTPLETPQSVSVITSQRILDQNLETISDVVRNAAGVSMDEIDDVRNTFSARGFEIQNYQVDGVPLPWSLAGDSGETIVDVVIYDRVEVVRGATGLMTGAGDPSASINLVRKHAGSSELAGYVDVGTGRWGNAEATLDVGSGLGLDGALRGRLVAKYSAGESYQDYLEEESSIFYGVVEADISHSTLLRLGASYQNNDPSGVSWGALPTWFSDGSFTDWPRSKSTAAEWTRWETTNENYFANLIQKFSNGWSLRGSYNRLENAQETELLYLYGVVDRDSGEGLFYWPYKSEGESVLDSFDLQLRGDFELLSQTHEFVVGGLYSEQDAQTTAYDPLQFFEVGNFFDWDGSSPRPVFASAGYVAQDQDTEQQGVYGASRLSLSDGLKLILGGRFNNWERAGIDYGDNLDYGDESFIPYAGVLYDLSESHRLYASYTEIYQPQNFRDIDGNLLDPEEGESYELGVKSAWLDGRLETSFAYFLIRQDNLAQGTGEFVNPETLEQAYEAVEGTESEGVDLELIGSVTDNWQISASYTDFRAEDGDGNDVNTDQPRELFKLFTTYQWGGLTLGGGVNWQGDIYSDIVNPATGAADKLEQESYALVNLMARYAFSDRLSLQVNIDNVTDESYYSQVGFFDQYRYGSPRDYSLHVNYRF